MKEHYALSLSQKEYLLGVKTLSNPSTERDRIKIKALQAWSIFKPILESNVVTNEWKYSLFEEIDDKAFDDFGIVHDKFTFRHFLKSLLKTDQNNPSSQEIERMKIAKLLIDEGLLYYLIRFKNNQFVYDKIKEYKEFLEMLQGIYEQELDSLVKADFVRLRKGMPRPPRIQPDQFYHAVCIQCYSYSFNQANTEQDAVYAIEHSKDCPFVKEFSDADHWQKELLIQDFIKHIPPARTA